MKVFTEVYKEVSTLLVNNITDLAWADLWHNQINFLEDEYAFPFPCVFLDFRSLNIEDRAKGDQLVHFEMTIRLAYETLADTYEGSFNQASALAYADLMEQIHLQLHTKSGTSFHDLRRSAFYSIETGSNVLLYAIAFEGYTVDCSIREAAEANEVEVTDPELELVEGQRPATPEEEKLFDVEQD